MVAARAAGCHAGKVKTRKQRPGRHCANDNRANDNRANDNRADDNQAEQDDSQIVIVPRADKPLAPIPYERVRRLRQHLVETLRAPLAVKQAAPPATQPPDLAPFPARVARIACTLCEGWCCRNGGEHAYLDERVITRLCQSTPGLNARAVLRLYLNRVPEQGIQGSCIFHGRQGCTLNPGQRSDVCNLYFCGGLGTYVTRGDTTQPVTIIAGEGTGTRTSPLLRP